MADLLAELQAAKAALHDAEAAQAKAHRIAGRLVRLALAMDLVTQAQADELLTPPGAGTPKTPEQE